MTYPTLTADVGVSGRTASNIEATGNGEFFVFSSVLHTNIIYALSKFCFEIHVSGGEVYAVDSASYENNVCVLFPELAISVVKCGKGNFECKLYTGTASEEGCWSIWKNNAM